MPEPFYDPGKSYEENFTYGPFGAFASDPPKPVCASLTRSSFLGCEIGLPFGIPAGPLLNGRYVKAALDHGFNLPVYKTVRTRKYASHAWPNVLAVDVEGDLRPDGGHLRGHDNYSGPLSITNSFGVPSFDPEFWQPDLADAVRHARPGQMVIGSFQGTTSGTGDAASYVADFAHAAKLVSETGVHAIEANLSCPNEGTAHLLCFDVDRSRRVVEAIRDAVGSTPLMVKIAYFAEEERLGSLLAAIGPLVDAIACINTIPAPILNHAGEQALPGEGRLWSGVCGRAIKWAGLEMTERLGSWRDRLGLDFRIVGVGGVSHTIDYLQYRHAGADAVMSATGAMWNPALAEEIRRDVNIH